MDFNQAQLNQLCEAIWQIKSGLLQIAGAIVTAAIVRAIWNK